ncbi:MAG TPA: FAD-dependent oxidoreductase, partial [Burkholderiaceae bacterium]|nr:FAD-dependent oxidoreductase [Burkholderiaceae bacterium]
MSRKQLALVVVLLALIAAFFVFDLGRFFSLAYVKASQAEFAALYDHHPTAVIGVFFAIYVAVAALSIPGAVPLTLAAGAIFGLLAGTVIVSFASSIGATLAFLAARFVLRDAVQTRFGARLAEIDKGIAREGAFYLFTLRLVPLVPFFLINLLMGLTRMRTWTFYWVSQLGMLAGTLVYVNAGTQLARIESLAGIASPALLGSFALLGVFPLIANRVVDAIEARRVYARWRAARPRRFDRNLVVIGAGSAGLVASYIAAAVKASVTLVEGHKMGGDCLNTGCVPSKALIRTAKLAHQIRHSATYGIAAAQARMSFADVMQRVQRIVAAIEPHDSVARYSGLGVDVVLGRATIVDPWHVRIAKADGGEVTLSTRAIVLATGAAPVVPPLPGIEEVGVLTSDTLWDLRELPQRLVVLGGGPVGCELAQAFARLGSQVTQIEMVDRLLVREDAEVSAYARRALESDGVVVLTGHKALRCELDAAGTKAIVTQAGGVEHRIGFDALICAVGRAARLKGYGLEELGIPASKTIETNDRLQTIYPNIYACGDVAGPYQFTHTASHQAWYASVNALFGFIKKFRADYSVIPWATFIDP